jgi:hypothetical protein
LGWSQNEGYHDVVSINDIGANCDKGVQNFETYPSGWKMIVSSVVKEKGQGNDQLTESL